MTEATVYSLHVTGKGRSVVIAEARALAENDAPEAGRRHRDDTSCKCARCAYVTMRVCRALFALKWSPNAIARAVGRKRATVLYHIKADYRARKVEYARKWHEAHPYIPVQRRTQDQKAWDNLGGAA